MGCERLVVWSGDDDVSNDLVRRLVLIHTGQTAGSIFTLELPKENMLKPCLSHTHGHSEIYYR